VVREEGISLTYEPGRWRTVSAQKEKAVSDSVKELYEEAVASQLKVWDDEIDHLDAMADIILAQVEDRYYGLLKSLRRKEREVREQLDLLKRADENSWETVRSDIASTTRDLKVALGEAIEELEPARS
jgi:hypothetical protein